MQIHLAVLHKNKKDRAVVFPLLTDAPLLFDPEGVIENVRVTLHLRIDGDDDLVGSLALELRELFIESERLVFWDDVRVVVEIRGRLRRKDFGRGYFIYENGRAGESRS